jgi:hypothetical protein
MSAEIGSVINCTWHEYAIFSTSACKQMLSRESAELIHKTVCRQLEVFYICTPSSFWKPVARRPEFATELKPCRSLHSTPWVVTLIRYSFPRLGRRARAEDRALCYLSASVSCRRISTFQNPRMSDHQILSNTVDVIHYPFVSKRKHLARCSTCFDNTLGPIPANLV